jgi:AraC-like DNA-binding protein
MNFKYFLPSAPLKPYIKCYYLFESYEDLEYQDTVFPSGTVEVIFNLGEGIWESSGQNNFSRTPPIELWGQLTQPLAIQSKGKHTMLGIRFLTHAAAYLFRNEIGTFNNQVSDLGAIMGAPIRGLHAQLLETRDLPERLELVEGFLRKRLAGTEKNHWKIDKVVDLVTRIKKSSAENTLTQIAASHGITPRYLHKLTYQYTGLSPKALNKIHRFQRSLQLIAKREGPLTSIAYDCGYFDQSHFIRDFKSFTGLTPSAYVEKAFPDKQLFLA